MSYAVLYNRNYGNTQSFSDVCWQIALNSGTAQSFTIPGPSTIQFQITFSFNENANVFITKTSPPTSPVTSTSPSAGTTTTQQYNELRPHRKYVNGGDSISIVCPDAGTTYVGASLMQLNQS